MAHDFGFYRETREQRAWLESREMARAVRRLIEDVAAMHGHRTGEIWCGCEVRPGHVEGNLYHYRLYQYGGGTPCPIHGRSLKNEHYVVVVVPSIGTTAGLELAGVSSTSSGVDRQVRGGYDAFADKDPRNVRTRYRDIEKEFEDESTVNTSKFNPRAAIPEDVEVDESNWFDFVKV